MNHNLWLLYSESACGYKRVVNASWLWLNENMNCFFKFLGSGFDWISRQDSVKSLIRK